MLKSKDELKDFYNTLNKKYEGYIQMSDNKIEHIFKKASDLPSWDDLHSEINFILELVLFEPDTNRSILIRQANDKWTVLDKILSNNETIDTFYTLKKDALKMKIAQIWEAKCDEFCLDMEVLEPKYLLFAGFEKEKK